MCSCVAGMQSARDCVTSVCSACAWRVIRASPVCRRVRVSLACQHVVNVWRSVVRVCFFTMRPYHQFFFNVPVTHGRHTDFVRAHERGKCASLVVLKVHPQLFFPGKAFQAHPPAFASLRPRGISPGSVLQSLAINKQHI